MIYIDRGLKLVRLSLAALADKARRLSAQSWAQPLRSPTTMYRFRADSQLGRILMVQGAHGVEYLMRLLQTAVSQRCRTDPTDSTTIKCSAEFADALGRSSFHVWELRTLLMTHVIKLPETVAARSPSGVIVPTEGVGIGVYISHTDFFTLREDFHRLLKLTPGAVQGRNLYLFQEVLNLTHDYLKTSPLFIDPRSPQAYFLGDDPMASVLGSRSFHRSQIPRLVQPMLQSTPHKAPAQRTDRARDPAEVPSGRAAPPPPAPPPPPPALPRTPPAPTATVTSEEIPTTKTPTPTPTTTPAHTPPPPETSSSSTKTKTIRLGAAKRKFLYKGCRPAACSSSPEDSGQGGGRDSD